MSAFKYIDSVKVIGNTSTPKALLILIHGLSNREEQWIRLCEEVYTKEMPDLLCMLPQAQEHEVTLLKRSATSWYDIVKPATEVADKEGVLGSAKEILDYVNSECKNNGWGPLPTVFGGFSQGGLVSLTATLINASTDGGVAVKGVASLCGFMGSQSALFGLSDTKPKPFSFGVFHGAEEKIVPLPMIKGASEAVKSALGDGICVGPYIEYPGLDHAMNDQMMKVDVLAFLKQTLF